MSHYHEKEGEIFSDVHPPAHILPLLLHMLKMQLSMKRYIPLTQSSAYECPYYSPGTVCVMLQITFVSDGNFTACCVQ